MFSRTHFRWNSAVGSARETLLKPFWPISKLRSSLTVTLLTRGIWYVRGGLHHVRVNSFLITLKNLGNLALFYLTRLLEELSPYYFLSLCARDFLELFSFPLSCNASVHELIVEDVTTIQIVMDAVLPDLTLVFCYSRGHFKIRCVLLLGESTVNISLVRIWNKETVAQIF